VETLHPRCAGLDVHKDSIAVCVRHWENGHVRQAVRTFGTMTSQLLQMADWLESEGVGQVAMESTGVYWKPVWNLLEDRFVVLVVNAKHIKQVPGRKTDILDCQWISQLLQHGLLQASFVPDRPQRELRDLTRQRWQLTAEKARAANRIQKVLEDANIKLASVASDVLGVSGREMIRSLIRGQEDPEAMADLARQRMRKKIPQLREALTGKVTDHHRFMLRQLLDHVQYLERQIDQYDRRIEGVLRPGEREAVVRLSCLT
jgi:transposase